MDDIDSIELVPTSSRFFDDTGLLASRAVGPGGEDPEARLAWTHRVEAYEGELASAYRRLRAGAAPGRSHPHHGIRVDGRTLEVSYDGTLDQQLRALYVAHGWAGITALREGLAKAASSYPSRALHPWDVVEGFASYAIAALWARVRQELVAIDRLATADLVVQLNVSADLVNEAWQTLGVVTKDTDEYGKAHRTPESSASWDTPIWRTKKFFRLTEERPLGQLIELLPAVVAARRRLGEIMLAEGSIFNAVEGGEEEFGRSTFPGDASMKRSIADLADEHERVKAELEGMLTRIHQVTPLAVLAVPLLQEPVGRIAIEQAIGEVLQQFRGEAERIVRGMPPQGTSWVAAALPNWKADQPVPLAYADERSPEVQLLDIAVERAGHLPAVLSMLSTRTLDRLVETGAVSKDSFLFSVWAHYQRQLIRRLAAEEVRAKAVRELGSLLERLAALLALWVIKRPIGTLTAKVAAVVNVGMLTFQCYATVAQVARIDRQLAQAMTNVDQGIATSLLHVGELLSSRREIADQIDSTIVTELGLIVAAGAWPLFRELMHVRGYYADLQTLLES